MCERLKPVSVEVELAIEAHQLPGWSGWWLYNSAVQLARLSSTNNQVCCYEMMMYLIIICNLMFWWS